jgi:membrane-associated phospholipid phosphatase
VTYLFLFDFVVRSPISAMDHLVTGWFHLHLAQPFIDLMLGFSALASPVWVGTLTCGTLLFSVLKRWWYASLAVVLTIPAGTLMGEGIKILVHRERPFHESPFLDLTGYSFASGHTISATLLYGLLAVFAILLFKSWRRRAVAAVCALLMVFLVGLSRIALGAHYPTDVFRRDCRRHSVAGRLPAGGAANTPRKATSRWGGTGARNFSGYHRMNRIRVPHLKP